MITGRCCCSWCCYIFLLLLLFYPPQQNSPPPVQDNSGSCFGIFPDAPLMRIPEPNVPAFAAFLLASKVLNRQVGTIESHKNISSLLIFWLLQIRLRLPLLRPGAGLEGGLPRLPPPPGGGGDGAQAGRHGAVGMKGGPGPSWMYFFCKDDFDLAYFY